MEESLVRIQSGAQDHDLVAELVSSLRLLIGRPWVRVPPGSHYNKLIIVSVNSLSLLLQNEVYHSLLAQR
jgi:hypothetical protein